MKHIKPLSAERVAPAVSGGPLKSLLWLLILGSVSEKQAND